MLEILFSILAIFSILAVFFVIAVFGISHILEVLMGQDSLPGTPRGCRAEWPMLCSAFIIGLCVGFPYWWTIAPQMMSALGPRNPDPGLLGSFLVDLMAPVWKYLAFNVIFTSTVRYVSLTSNKGKALAGSLVMALPLLGLLVGIQITRVSTVEAWHSLGSPPEPVARIVDADFASISITTTRANSYACCTEEGQWTAGGSGLLGDNWAVLNAPIQVMLTTPTVDGISWSCPTCRFQYDESDLLIAMPAPPVPLAQPTVFYGRGGCYTFGGAGIAGDGTVWEWRRFAGCKPAGYWYLTSDGMGRITRGGLLGALVGAMGSALVIWAVRRRAGGPAPLS